MVEKTDIRRCGKCHQFQEFEIKIEENPTKKRIMKCKTCGETMVESIYNGYGVPFKD